MLKRLLLCLALILAPALAHAQAISRSSQEALNNQYFIACGTGCITGPIINNYFGTLNNSVGFLADTNAWTGANSFTVSPTVPTPSPGDNSTKVANTAFTQTAITTAFPTNSVPLIWQAPAGATLGQGCSTAIPGHYLTFLDQNSCRLMDQDTIIDNDPSILFSITYGGTVNTAGAGEKVTFTFGTGACSAGNGGCSVQYINQGGDTLTNVATGIVAAIKANTNLWNPAPTSYANQAQFLNVTNGGGASATVSIDSNGNNNLIVTVAALGGSTVTQTLSPSACTSTGCPNQLDVPLLTAYVAKPGFTIANGSTLAATTWSSTFSGGNGLYAQMTVQADDVTTSRGRFLFSVGNSPILGGVYIGEGVYGLNEAEPGADATAFQKFKITNPANASNITLINNANTTSHNLNMPIIAADDTLACKACDQTFAGLETFSQAIQGNAGAIFSAGVSFADSGTWTASGINSTTIGSSTPGTGKFTTLTDTGLSVAGFVTNSAAGLLGTSSLGTGVATAMGLSLNGSGALSATTSPTFVTPVLGVASATSMTAANGTANGYIFKDNEGTTGGSVTEGSGDNVFFTAGNGATCSPNCLVAIRDVAGNPEFEMVNGSATPTTATAYLADLSTIDATTTAAGGSSMAFAGGIGVTKKILGGSSILSNAAAGGVGYTTGAGCAVTQVTSRTTGVTCTGESGAVTLFSAAGSASFQTFIVTDTSVAATDVIEIAQKSGTDKYQVFVTAVAAGSFAITFATTGGTTTEQPVFNFSVIKGVTSELEPANDNQPLRMAA